ncbi:sensor histidine kinase [Fusibacter ferrireducens]|uniref:GHKL domain-containing protein n=1 Tax=Fusibacter ferrireducens TaxID=2785058 RepID=A0ABR9ZX07_9FIRM|nr:sensor histidine kinase [Fusibacter ferrireducens]MBF4694990.1 GHKL domain-containing protein [Fusibacter ferrireducens]
MKWLIIENAINLFEMFIVLIFLKKQFLQVKKTSVADDLIVVIAGSVILSYLNHSFDTGSIYVMLIMFLYWLIIGVRRYGRASFLKIVLAIITVDIILIACEFILIVLMGFFFKTTPMDLATLGTDRFVFVINSKLLAFLVVNTLQTTQMNTGVGKRYQSLILILMLMLNIIIAFFVIDIYRTYVVSEKANQSVIFVSFVMLGCNILVLFISKIFYKATQIEIEKKMVDLSLSQQSDQITALKGVMDEVRRNQHDYKNHFQAIRTMVSHDKLNEALSYIDVLLGDQSALDKNLKTSMTAIELILEQKINEALQFDIEVEKEVLIPSNLNALEYSMAMIISNSMDNAIEACQFVPSNASIKIKIFMRKGYLNYYIENTSSGEYRRESGRYLTRKKEKTLHGYGLRNIEELVNKHNGFFEIQALEDKFILKCSMLVDENETF